MNKQQSDYQPVIGLEVHVQLNTRSKMFCSNRVPQLGEQPNSEVCPVCLGLPGALPVPNKQAVEWTILLGLALDCEISNFSKFDRKNYFYPDLPKGYQISQYDLPLCKNGKLKLENGKEVRIRRVHLEEDTGKLIHSYQIPKTQKLKNSKTQNYSLIDFNRSGVPLVEIVTEPDFESAAEVIEYLKKLQQIVRYLGVADADMEKGQMRLEPNISVREIKNQKSKIKNELPGYKVEIKNINSFKFVERAINYEIERQREILEKGGKIVQETRGFDEKRGMTVLQRTKEEAQDYRYFPEPDIPPVRWEKSQITRPHRIRESVSGAANLKSQIPELPDQKKKRFMDRYGLTTQQATVLTQTRQMADFFEEAVKVGKKYKIRAVEIANIIINKRVAWEKMLPAQLIGAIVKGKRGAVVPAKKLDKAIKSVLKEQQKAASSYKSGKIQVLGFLIAQVLKLLPEAEPRLIKEELEKQLL